MNVNRLVPYLIVGIVLLDQALKFYVKTHYYLAQGEILFGLNWVWLLFVENEGMALGLTFGGTWGKPLLTLSRMVATVMLGLYLWVLLRGDKRGNPTGRKYVLGFALVLAGAVGNLIDSIFYGRLFSASTASGGVAEFWPRGGGYAPLLHGNVVDMFWLPVCYGRYPGWLPGVGGEPFIFFQPVFNLADVAITVGVLVLLVRLFSRGMRKRSPIDDTGSDEAN